MANPSRGEVEGVLDGERRTLCLTLSALAELERAFAVPDLLALAERLSSGRLSARDVARVLGAGLRGAGAEVSDAEVGAMRVDGGAAGAARLAADLLALAFGAEPVGPERPANP